MLEKLKAMDNELRTDYSGVNVCGNCCPKGNYADCSKGNRERALVRLTLSNLIDHVQKDIEVNQ